MTAEQSAQKKVGPGSGRPAATNWPSCSNITRHDTPQQIPLGSYDIVFGSAATGDLLSFMNWIGFNGGSMKRGFSFLSEDKVGQKVFSDKFTLVDDPDPAGDLPVQARFDRHRPQALPDLREGRLQGLHLVPG